jgi:hypothetical protein
MLEASDQMLREARACAHDCRCVRALDAASRDLRITLDAAVTPRPVPKMPRDAVDALRRMFPVSVWCRHTHQQYCGDCEDAGCTDNTNPAVRS